MKIGYYKCTTKVERNAMFPIHVLYDPLSWDENVLKQRCLLGNRKAIREALPHEVETQEHNWRAVSYKYTDIKKLIADEERAGTDTAFIKQLQEVLS